MSTTRRRYLLVDGHSVIHAWPELRVLHLNSRKRHLAREQLLQHLRHLHDMGDEQVIVVFDGNQSRVTDEREPQGLQIFYADQGHTADSIIERLVAKYAQTHDMRAATADGMICETIAALGAYWISPETLRTLCETSASEMRRHTKGSR